jgi:hypothetical protein
MLCPSDWTYLEPADGWGRVGINLDEPTRSWNSCARRFGGVAGEELKTLGWVSGPQVGILRGISLGVDPGIESRVTHGPL